MGRSLYVESALNHGVKHGLIHWIGQIDREGNPRKVVNCSCVVVKDWGEKSQEPSILVNYFQTEQ